MDYQHTSIGSRLKSNQWVSPAYGDFIRNSGELVCCITKRPHPVNHHLIGHGYSATGMKAPDVLQMALSHSLHAELHDRGWQAFEAKYKRSQWSLIAETLLASHLAGFLNIRFFEESNQLPDELINELFNQIGVPVDQRGAA